MGSTCAIAVRARRIVWVELAAHNHAIHGTIAMRNWLDYRDPTAHRAALARRGYGRGGFWDNRWKRLINVLDRDLAPAAGVA